MLYNIAYVTYPVENDVYQQTENGKVNFYDNNTSLNICAAMILGIGTDKIEKRSNFHRLFYGKYLAGFAFEGSDRLPPLSILQTIHENMANNAVFYKGTVYDPKLGVFSIAEYERQNIIILSYVQMFIPAEIQAELLKDADLNTFFHNLPPLQQSKILNYIYPFSKPSSFKECRTLAKPITPAKTQSIISHIKSLQSAPQTGKTAWDELIAFETSEAVEILIKCGVAKGMTVLDMGCGHGHYTFSAAIAAGTDGKVIAVDTEIEGSVLKYVENRAAEYNLKNIFCLKTNERGLSSYKESIDFIILYDVLHGSFNYTKSDWGVTTKHALIDHLTLLLKNNGILSFALYSEIEHKRLPLKTKDGTDSYKTIPLPHTEAIQPYLELIQASGLTLYNIVENGGVHFDDFHKPALWRKYGEVKISSLERRNVYNFIKLRETRT